MTPTTSDGDKAAYSTVLFPNMFSMIKSIGESFIKQHIHIKHHYNNKGVTQNVKADIDKMHILHCVTVMSTNHGTIYLIALK